MRYLLDTNVASNILRHPQGRAAARLDDVGDSHVCTSIIVAAELRYGAMKKGSQRLTVLVNGFLSRIAVLPFAPPADETYARLRTHLEPAGHPIGANDLLIAAQALAIKATVVTANERELSRIEGVTVENWLRD